METNAKCAPYDAEHIELLADTLATGINCERKLNELLLNWANAEIDLNCDNVFIAFSFE
jgi:hypothetical protein